MTAAASERHSAVTSQPAIRFRQSCCLISNYCEKRILDICKELKLVQHYNPEVIILEYTGCVVLAPELKKIFPDARYVAKEHDVTYIGYERKKDYYKGFNLKNGFE